MLSKHLLYYKLKSYGLLIESHALWMNGFMMKYVKYIVVRICPVMMNGSSTGRAPIHDRRIADEASIQNVILLIG